MADGSKLKMADCVRRSTLQRVSGVRSAAGALKSTIVWSAALAHGASLQLQQSMQAFELERLESLQRYSRSPPDSNTRIRDFVSIVPASEGERVVSVKLVGGLQERAPSLHAIVRRKGPSGNRRAVHLLGFIEEYLAMSLRPHGPIAGADADAEIVGEEI